LELFQFQQRRATHHAGLSIRNASSGLNIERVSDREIERLGNFVNKLELAQALQIRTKQFAIRIIGAFSDLPKTEASRVIGRQFVRSGTAIAANYRAACRARSQAEFVSKDQHRSGGDR
jgi:hypothetical protein